MSFLAKGIAHLSFQKGGLFLPALDDYDRQSLVEHVVTRVRSEGLVQVLIDDRRWMVRLHAERCTGCSECGHSLDAGTCSAADDPSAAYCVNCVFARGNQCPAMAKRRANDERR